MSISIEDIRDGMLETSVPVERKRDMRQRDNQGKIVSGEAKRAIDPETGESIFVPVRVWTAGPGMPQEKIYLGGRSNGLRPSHDGAYNCDTPEKLETAKKALGARFWVENVPLSEEPQKCDTCNWRCRSYAAMLYHVQNAHGKAQQ